MAGAAVYTLRGHPGRSTLGVQCPEIATDRCSRPPSTHFRARSSREVYRGSMQHRALGL